METEFIILAKVEKKNIERFEEELSNIKYASEIGWGIDLFQKDEE